MRENKVPTEGKTKGNSERGSALLLALLCMVALFAITIAATRTRVSNAKDIEDRNAQAIQYWQARSAAANIQASLITDIPQAFDADLQRAQIAANGYPLPAFDQTNIAAQYSLPLINSDGSVSSRPASQCTSLLGNLDAWAARKASLAESYASTKGFGTDKARVAVLREYQRQQLIGIGNSEPAYVLQYMVDAAVGETGNARGRVRPSGTIMLGPSQPTCNTTVSLTASPTTINLGNSTTLTITYTNANHVWIVDQTGAVIAGTDRTGLTDTNAQQTLSFTVSPISDTSYRAVAQGSSGCQAISAFVTVSVTYPPPLILAFDINPTCITRGETATLTFQVQYAQTITITGGGVNQTFPGNPGASITSGSFDVAPTVDTTYTLTATGNSGTASRNVTVQVKQPLTVDQFVSDNYCLVSPANTVNLTWAVLNAETVTITDNSTEVVTGVSATGGTRSFTVNNPTTFTITAMRTGCNGPEYATRDISINTNVAPTASLSANPSTIAIGSGTVLQWNTTNTTSVTISASPAAGSGLPSPQTVTESGTLTIQPTAVNSGSGYTYTLTATNAGCATQTVTRTTTVFVTAAPAPPPCPNVSQFDGDACIVNGNAATLRWNVANSDWIKITGPGVNQTFSGNPVGSGSMSVLPSTDATYTLTSWRNQPAGSSPPTNGLIAYWPFDEGTGTSSNDASGNSQTAFLYNNTSWTSGKVGPSAVSFDGATNLVGINVDSWALANTFSYTFWANPSRAHTIDTESTSGYAGYYNTHNFLLDPSWYEAGEVGAGISVATNGVSIYENGDSDFAPVLVYNAPISGWTQITVVYQNKQPKLYINGTLVRTGLTSRQRLVHLTPDYIGGGFYGYYGGSVDDTRIYNRALTDTEITTIYNNGNPALASCTPASPPNPTTASFTVHVGQRPSVSNLQASPSNTDSGQLTQLTWSNSGNFSNTTIIGSGGDTNTYTVPASQQSLWVRPASTSTYTVSVTNTDCSAQAANQSTTVTVWACSSITVPFSASPTSIIQGNSSTLQWGIANASQVLLNGSPVAPSGSMTVTPPPGSNTYRLTALSHNGTCSFDQFVTVNVAACPVPTITSFTASPGTVTAGGSQMVRLSWNVNDGSGTGASVTINGVGTFGASGFVDISQPQSTTTYLLTARNGCGAQSTAQTTVTVNACPPPIINSFSSNPNTVFIGGNRTVRLSWSIGDPSSTGMTINIAGVGTFANPNGFVDIAQPQSTTAYTLTATAGCGASATAQTTVVATACPQPNIQSFATNPNSVTIGGGQTVRLSWNVTDPSGTGLSVTISNVSGTFGPSGFVDIPQPQSTTPYTLTATAGCGAQSTAQVTVTASACPTPSITQFTASPGSVIIGGSQTVRLSWNVVDNSGFGVSVTLSNVSGTFGPSGFVDIPQPQSTTTYTLTATAGCGASASAQTTVTASSCPPPTINSFTSTPASVLIGGGQNIRLAWNVTDNSGYGVGVNISNVSGTFGPSGFVDIAQPQSTTTYTLTATSGCGAQSTAQVTVIANPPSAATSQIDLPFFSPTSPGPLFTNPNDSVVKRFPGTYTFNASAGFPATATITWGAYPIATTNTCFGTQTFVEDDGIPWTVQFIAADNATVLDSFTFDRPGYDGGSMSWTGSSPLAMSAAYVRFSTSYYMNRYQLTRDTNECELVIDHYVSGTYTGTLDMSTGIYTNGAPPPP
jgi:plastocyanin